MRRLFIIICSILMIASLTACGIGVRKPGAQQPDDTAQLTPAPVEPATQPPAEKTEYGIGETWTVDGLWTVTILGATEIEERNQFSERNPAAVYLVDYVYTNDGYDDGIMDGLYMSIDDTIVDANGVMGYSYPGDISKYPQETPAGATCYAQACIGVDNPGTFSVTVKQYDAEYNEHKATFTIDPTLPHVEYTPKASGGKNSDALKIGETWTVDGLWSLTITGVTETAERNQFSDKQPGAVYIVDYTYKNLGYDDDIMDGLYMTIDEMIVDAGGQMGYSYPGDITNYPQETPVGATCNAQECIGVENPGSFTITVTKYDNDYNKHSQTFLIETNGEV